MTLISQVIQKELEKDKANATWKLQNTARAKHKITSKEAKHYLVIRNFYIVRRN
jgi:hypothetical protein